MYVIPTKSINLGKVLLINFFFNARWNIKISEYKVTNRVDNRLLSYRAMMMRECCYLVFADTQIVHAGCRTLGAASK